MLHRTVTLIVALTVLVMAVRFYVRRGAETQEKAREEQALASAVVRLPEVCIDHSSLGDAIDWIGQQSGLSIRVDWDALGREEINAATPIRARLRDVKVDKVLRTVLDEAGGGRVRLGYSFRKDGWVFISSERDLLSAVDTRRYDIRDLLGRVPAQQPQLEEAICTLIMDIVASDSWKTNGGEFADIHDGFIVVTQTPDAHRSVRRLLKQLRETRSFARRVLTAEYSTTWAGR